MLAERAAAQDEVPVGAVVIKDGDIIGEGWNQPITHHDPTAHAEIGALRAAGQRMRNYRLNGTTLYVTLEPCVMCFGAMIHARIDRLVFGATDPKSGVITTALSLPKITCFNHQFTWEGGVNAEACANVLTAFFRQRR